MNDAEFLRHYVEDGSQEAFAELVRLRIGFVYSAALRQAGGDTHWAQEITQVVFTDLARKAPSLRRHSSLTGWLYTSTRYAASKIVRAERRRRVREQEAYTMHVDLSQPISEIQSEQLRPLLDDAMSRLPDLDRRALLLRFFDDCSMAELGRHLGLSETTAKKRVERALGKLKTQLARRGLLSTAAAVGAALSQEAVAATVPAGLAATVSGSALVAASAAGPSLGLIFFMTAQKLTAIIGVTSILGLVSISIGVYELRRSLRAQAALATASQRYETEQQQLQALLQSSQAADKALADLKTAAKRVADPAKSAANAQPDFQRFVVASPELHAKQIDIRKATFGSLYRLFFVQARPTPAQIEEFENHMINGGRPSDNQMRAILGDQGFQQLQDYQRTQIPSNFVLILNRDNGFAEEPISSAQEIQLAQIIANNCPAYQNGQNVDPNSVDWTNAEAQAQSILSPVQWKMAERAFLAAEYNSAVAQAQRSQNANPAASGEGK